MEPFRVALFMGKMLHIAWPEFTLKSSSSYPLGKRDPIFQLKESETF